MRRMSFAHTAEQMRSRAKTVTRRRGGWWASVLRPGSLIAAYERTRGVKTADLVPLGVLRVVRVGTEALYEIQAYGNPRDRTDDGRGECVKEGYPGMIGEEFVEMFCREMGGDFEQIVTRIEFELIETTPELRHLQPRSTS